MSDAALDQKLVRAVRAGEAETVRRLLAAGADPNVRNSRGMPVLIQVAEANLSALVRADIMHALFDHQVDPNQTDTRGATAFHAAAAAGQWQAMRLLLARGADIDARAANGETPLHYAARVAAGSGRLETLKFMLELGVNSQVRDNTGLTALESVRDRKRLALHTVTVVSLLEVWERDKDPARRWREQRALGNDVARRRQSVLRSHAPRLKL